MKVIDVEEFYYPMFPMKPSGNMGVLLPSYPHLRAELDAARAAGRPFYLRHSILSPASHPTPAPVPPATSEGAGLTRQSCPQTIPDTTSSHIPSAIGKLNSHSENATQSPSVNVRIRHELAPDLARRD